MAKPNKPFKQIDTRNKEGIGLTYTEYDVTMEDWARAPKTRLDGRFQIKTPRTFEKPGEIKYYGASQKEAAEKLNQDRFSAYERRQQNEYIRTGSAAPGEKIERQEVSQGEIRQARQDFRSQDRGRADRGDMMRSVENKIDQLKNAAVATASSLGIAAGNPTGNLRTALKSARSFANFRTQDEDEGKV